MCGSDKGAESGMSGVANILIDEIKWTPDKKRAVAAECEAVCAWWMTMCFPCHNGCPFVDFYIVNEEWPARNVEKRKIT